MHHDKNTTNRNEQVSGKSKFVITLCFMFTLFIFSQYLFYKMRSVAVRNETSLLNRYYSLAKTNPEAAKKTLGILLKEHPDSQVGLREMGYWYLRQGDITNALQSFQAANRNDPNDDASALELATLYIQLHQNEKAKALLEKTVNSKNEQIHLSSLSLLDQIRKPAIITQPILDKMCLLSENQEKISWETIVAQINSKKSYTALPVAAEKATTAAVQKQASARDQMLNDFYKYKKINPKLAWRAILKLLCFYPNDVTALKEAGFFALSEKKNERAFYFLYRAFKLTNDPKLALQNGYILDGLKKRTAAFYYFNIATNTTDKKDEYKAQIALTNLRGYQFRLLPDPFFLDIYGDPFYYSRFKMTIQPYVVRLGSTLSEKYTWQVYLKYRRTTDNRTNLQNGLPQIYDDNVEIHSIGTQITPFPSIPLIAFVEAGKAKDLIFRQRGRLRSDFRGGFAFYKDWGSEAEYSFGPTYPMAFKADIYGDAIYFSRYRNYIFTLRVRPGIEVLRYGVASLILYFRGFLSQDTQREFFNNLFEYGIGAGLIPNDRINLAIRFEFTQGHYLPAGGGSKNPYGLNYHNNLYGVNFYIRF